jgi:hypothetical protein
MRTRPTLAAATVLMVGALLGWLPASGQVLPKLKTTPRARTPQAIRMCSPDPSSFGASSTFGGPIQTPNFGF